MAQFKKNKQPSKGFSLIEVLISFTILSISLIAITQLISTTIQANQQNTARLQAYYLSQQGLESVRHIRDSNWLQNIGFNSNGDQNTLWQSNNGNTSNITPTSSKEIIVDIQTNTLGNIQKNVSIAEHNNQNSRLFLVQDPQTNITSFTHQNPANALPTQFKRYIKITNNFQDLDKLEKNLQIQTLSGDQNFQLDQNLILVESIVQYGNNYDKEITLQTILTDWKEGPL